jgi:hypothetical protein
MRGEGFDAEGLGRVMPPVQHIDAGVLGGGKSPMRSFARDEGIDPLARGELEVAAGAAGDDADAPADRGPARQSRSAICTTSDRWGAKYFDINEEGHVVAKPLQEAGVAVDLTDVIEEARGGG